MKIVRAQTDHSVPWLERSRPFWKALWARWYAQAFMLLLAFLAGALVYRSNIYLPVWSFARGLISGIRPEITLPEPAAEIVDNLKDEVRMYENNGLPTLYIDLPFEGYQKLLEKRAEAIEIGVLNTTDEDFVDARVNLQGGPSLDAKLRLKGDWTDHLEGDKWSFRIHLKEDGQILRTRQFSIQSPDTRNFLYEWAFHKNLIQEGLLTTRYEFVNVLLNGKLLGIYALEENFAPELIESQGRRQGVIIRFDEDLMWQNIAAFWSQGIVQEGNIMVTDLESADITVFQASKIAEDPVLSAEAAAARGLLRAFQTGQRPAAEVFDVQQVGRFFALHDLWAACHGVAWHNLRFYYNPVTGLLEPVAYDAEPFVWCSTEQTIIGEFTQNRLFNDPDVRAAYARELERLTRPGYAADLQRNLAGEHDQIQKALEVEFGGQNVGVDWERLEARSQTLRLELQPAQTVRGSYQIIPAAPAEGQPARLEIDLVNLLLLPVEVLRVELDGQPLSISGQTVRLLPVTGKDGDVFQPVRISVTLPEDAQSNLEMPAVEVVTRLEGIAAEHRTRLNGSVMPEALVIGPAPAQPSLEQVLQQHPFLSANPGSPSALRVSQGVWDVQGDLILPPNTELFITAGSTLRFSQGSILYAAGPVHLLGTEHEPVVLTAQETDWGGVVVIGAGKRSTWKYAFVDKTAGISRSGWQMTGGVTFYKSDILLDHTVFADNQTEDALNVIHSNFEFRDSRFSNTFADAFDSDFSAGSITRCLFQDIAGDAVDVSGTTVTITDTKMLRIADKGVSAGEESTAAVSGVQMDTVGIGIASKDLSTVTVRGSVIRRPRFSALAAYIKKPVYGPARIEASGLEILEAETVAVAQRGSEIVLDGAPVAVVDLDVDRLYQEGILGN